MSRNPTYNKLNKFAIPNEWQAFKTPKGYSIAGGTSVPTTANKFAPGCIFIHTDGGDSTRLYVNNGTKASPDFELVMTEGMTVQSLFGASQGSGVVLSGTDPDQVLQVHGNIEATVASGAYSANYNTLTITKAQSNDVSAFGGWNELYVTGNIDLTGSSNYSGTFSVLELTDGGGSLTTPAGVSWMSGLTAVINSPDGLVNNTKLCGVIADSNMTSGFTNNSATIGFYARLNSGKAAWNYGLYVDDSATDTAGVYIGSGATRGLDCQNKGRFGTHDWGVGATGILLNGTDDDMVLIAAGRINAAVATGAYAAGYNQLAITKAQTNDVSGFGGWNELYITGTTSLGGSNYSGTFSVLEFASDGTATTPGGVSWMSGLTAVINSPSTLTNNTKLCGVVSDSNITSGFTNNSKTISFYTRYNSGKAAWQYGLYVDDSATSTAGVYIGSGATRALDSQGKGRFGTHDWGVGATGILLNGTDDDMVLIAAGRINAAVASGAYSAGYNQLAITTAQTNDVSGFGGWNELYVTGTTSLGGSNYSGTFSVLEFASDGTATTPAGVSWMSGLTAVINSPSTLTNNTSLCGVVSDSNMTSGFTNNTFTAAFYSRYNAGKAAWKYGLYNGVGAVTGDIKVQAEDAASLPCVIFSGAAANDGDIVTAVGADSLWADGSLYISVVDGAGKLFQKQNDVWVDMQA